MKKLVLVSALAASVFALFSFKASNTAQQQADDPANYQLNEREFQEFTNMVDAYQKDPNADLSKLPGIQAIAQAVMRMLLDGNGRICLDRQVVLVNPSIKCVWFGSTPTILTEKDIDLSEAYGIISKL